MIKDLLFGISEIAARRCAGTAGFEGDGGEVAGDFAGDPD